MDPDLKCLFWIRIRQKVTEPYGSGSTSLTISLDNVLLRQKRTNFAATQRDPKKGPTYLLEFCQCQEGRTEADPGVDPWKNSKICTVQDKQLRITEDNKYRYSGTCFKR
jgi:hypothetical protein